MKGLALVVVLGVSSASWAQSFNIDINSEFGPPELGNGVPSDSFGGAANTPGRWNRISAGGIGTRSLRGLDGNLTGATIVGPDGGSGGGHNIPINTGDYALLLNDARSVFPVGNGLEFAFMGLQNGRYEVYTYAVSIALHTAVRPTRVTIQQALGQTTRVSSGPMPGNQLIDGITHTTHTVTVTNGRIDILMESLVPNSNTYFNGIQIKQVVPEPTTLLATSIGLLTLLRQRRQRRVSS